VVPEARVGVGEGRVQHLPPGGLPQRPALGGDTHPLHPQCEQGTGDGGAGGRGWGGLHCTLWHGSTHAPCSHPSRASRMPAPLRGGRRRCPVPSAQCPGCAQRAAPAAPSHPAPTAHPPAGGPGRLVRAPQLGVPCHQGAGHGGRLCGPHAHVGHPGEGRGGAPALRGQALHLLLRHGGRQAGWVHGPPPQQPAGGAAPAAAPGAVLAVPVPWARYAAPAHLPPPPPCRPQTVQASRRPAASAAQPPRSCTRCTSPARGRWAALCARSPRWCRASRRQQQRRPRLRAPSARRRPRCAAPPGVPPAACCECSRQLAAAAAAAAAAVACQLAGPPHLHPPRPAGPRRQHGGRQRGQPLALWHAGLPVLVGAARAGGRRAVQGARHQLRG
jgi:hypothetical protein